MSMILLAVEDAARDAPVRDLLTAEGWWVTTVVSREEALRAAADHAPQLLIVDARLAAPGGLLHAFGRHEGGPGVLLLVDHEGDSVPEDGDGVVGRDQDPAELLAVVRRNLEAPRPAPDHPTVAPELTSEDEQLTTSELFGDILQGLGEEVGRRAGAATLPATAAAPAASEGEPDEPAPEVAAVEEPYEPLAPEVAAVEEPYEPLAPEVAAVEEPYEPLAPEVTAVVEPYEPLAPEVAAVEEPYEPLAPEVAAVEEPYEPLAAEAEAPEELDEPLAAEVPAVEEPAEVAAEDVAAVEEIAELAIGAQAAAAAEEPDWVIDRALDEDPAGEGAAAGEPASGQPLAAETSAEPSTDIEAVLADILEAEDAWDGPAEGADGAELGRLEELLAAPAAPAQESGAAEDEAVPAGLDEETALEVLGPYELLEMLEFGDLTERWRAVRSGDDGTEVVVERIRHELRSRADVRQAFVDGCSEAAGWAQENILPVVDLGRDGDVDYVATEYHRGHSLREVLERVRRMEARMPLGIGLLIAERVGAGLQTIAAGPAASRHGWLVPGSIWLTLDGEVLLREFGFGRLAAVADVAPLDWTEYRFLGPEVWSRQADSRSDLYSLGALLYEMIGGRKTHAADDLESLVATIRSTDIARAQTVDPTIPSEVDGWIMRLLRRSPSERPQAVAEIASKVDLALQSLPARPSNAELAAYLRQLFAARVPEQPAEAARPPAAVAAPVADADEVRPPAWRLGARRWRWWLAAALLALLVALLVWRWAAGRESSDTASRSADSAARLEGQPDAASRAQG